ncbi:MAG: PAS domain S-box protein [Phycisphaerae bacterium]
MRSGYGDTQVSSGPTSESGGFRARLGRIRRRITQRDPAAGPFRLPARLSTWVGARWQRYKARHGCSGPVVEREHERYWLANQATREVIWDRDLAVGRMKWNDALTGAFGYAPHELSTYQAWYERVHPEDRERVVSRQRAAVEGNAVTWIDEYRFCCRSGNYHMVLERGFIVRDARGRACRMVGSVVDTTDRRRAEETVRRYHDLLNGIIEGSGDLIAAMDVNFRFLALNRAYQAEVKRLFGADIQVGSSLRDITTPNPADMDCLIDLWTRALHGEEFTETHELGDPGRDRRYYEIRFSSIRDREGRLIGAAHIVRDVTERKRIEHRLQLTQFAVDHAAEPILRIDSAGHFMYVNEAACRLLGYTRDELLQMTVFDIDPLNPADLWPERWREVKERGAYNLESIYRRKSGETFPVEIAVTHLQHEGRDFCYAFVRDISAYKRAEEALRRVNAELARSNSDLEQFASIVSHDLRSPMLTISGYVFLLSSELGEQLSDEARNMLEAIRCTVDQMNELLKGLLGYSRVGRGGLNLARCQVDAVLRTVLTSLTAELQAAQARVMHGPMPEVRADELLLVQVFQNLISNAIKYRGVLPPEVHITAAQEPGRWVFSVTDNGIGIPPEHRERIFGMFQRLHADESKYGGTGIGLATCKKIVEQHGGRIWAEANEPQGSVFRFTLPR